MNGELYLGIDIGTSSSKGVLMDRCGKVVRSAQISHVTANPRPGWYEHDAEEIWYGECVRLCRELCTVGDIGDRVAAMAVSGIGPCVVPVGSDGRALRSAILYGIDSRAGKQINELTDWCARQGIPAAFDSQSVLPKILWLCENEPEVWEQTRWIAGCGGYITFRLCGKMVVDRYEAGCYAPARWLGSAEAWDTTLLNELGSDVVSRLAGVDVVPSTTVVGYLTHDAAADTGLSEGMPVVAPTIDAAAEATSAGVTHPGDVMVMYGSTGFFIALSSDASSGRSEKPDRAAEHQWRSEFLEPGQFSLAGGTNTLGTYVTWLMDMLRIESFEKLAELAESSVPGANGVLALPYLAGERTPLFDPELTAGFLGCRSTTSRADILRAGLEGLAYGVRNALESMEIGDDATLYAVGGGTRNHVLLQTVSDVTGLEQHVPKQTIGASLGNAMRAAVGVGRFGDLSQISAQLEYADTIRPRSQYEVIHNTRFGLYRDLTRATQEISHRLR
ncbi:FGGY-family carbohydrate kinase [Bifidobacterium cebidarum]|uniref:Sugar kinase n=1 Tax=Bifidobacterium cebidarum TaxID=2650773 RepID=A0A6I1GFE8_9BIFI|nr:FGGY family carbohydrate kinase [Bifidobacterium cebidarum]KAB7788109.1 sugar kinase [Bifidobacterium cebidarum]